MKIYILMIVWEPSMHGIEYTPFFKEDKAYEHLVDRLVEENIITRGDLAFQSIQQLTDSHGISWDVTVSKVEETCPKN
jgi:hypothetical protein|tara:strand:+ start:1110 stop:1343 length:234 start_codon:yes stop_codon:yes gene_type:complete